MIIDENWAIAPERSQAFFEELPGAVPTADGFEVDGCQIRLTSVDSTLFGKWTMKRTQIHMEGPDGPLNAIYRKFFLRFLSAGG